MKSNLSLFLLNKSIFIDIDAVGKNIFLSKDFHRLNLKKISKRFLKNYLGNINNLSFEKIRIKIISFSDKFNGNDFPNEENKFYKYICERFLNIDQSPINIFQKYKQNALNDINAINSNIKKLNQEKKDLLKKRKEKKLLNGEETYRIKLLEYYIKINKNAKKEIIIFLRKDINEKVIEKCKKSFFVVDLDIPPFKPAPYPYGRMSFEYDINKFSDIQNKLIYDISVGNYFKILDLLISKNKDENREGHLIIDKFIKENDEISKIKKLINENYQLSLRKDILIKLLNYYEQDKEIFCYITPLQIEGIFYDYCLELGCTEKELALSSFNYKIDKILEKDSKFWAYKYYAFKFPILRNKIAHGKLINDDLDILSNFLLLDLFDVCNLMHSGSLKSNYLLKLINEKLSDITLMEYVILRYIKEYKMPDLDFYQITKSIENIEDELSNNANFWVKLEKFAKGGNLILQKGALGIVNKLKKLNIGTEIQYIKIYKAIGKKIDDSQTDYDEFLKIIKFNALLQ